MKEMKGLAIDLFGVLSASVMFGVWQESVPAGVWMFGILLMALAFLYQGRKR